VGLILQRSRAHTGLLLVQLRQSQQVCKQLSKWAVFCTAPKNQQSRNWGKGPFKYYIKQKYITILSPIPMLYNILKRHPARKSTEPEIDMQNGHQHCCGSGK